MRITLLCSDPDHPVVGHLEKWISELSPAHVADLVFKKSDLTSGDFLFLVSCSEIITLEQRSPYQYSLVLHAGDLPRGRGWSPHIWEIVRGAEEITLSLLEAEDRVDSGRIWIKKRIPIAKDALWNEINTVLFNAETDLMTEAINNCQDITPCEQSLSLEPSYYPRRTPKDSEIDPAKSIQEQFDLIRVCDPIRYPARFELYGKSYKIVLEKSDHE